MAKAKKVDGVKLFLKAEEASALYMLLYRGLSHETRGELGLDQLQESLGATAYWKPLDFATKATLGKEE